MCLNYVTIHAKTDYALKKLLGDRESFDGRQSDKTDVCA